MTTTDVAARTPDELMAQVAVLLDRAAVLAWQQAEGAVSPLHDLGLGVYLARGTAAQPLNVGRQVKRAAAAGVEEPEDIDERSVLDLLTDAESLLGARADLIHSGLAVELCDLIREARALGC